MATRKGKGRQAVRNSGGGFPAWGWAVIGILVGVGLMVAYNRHALLPAGAPSGPQPNPQATAERGSEPGVADSSAPAEADKPKKPQYDFYSALTEKDVRIPDAEISAQARAEQQQKQQQQAAAAQAQQQAQAAQAGTAPRATPPARNLPAAVSQTITAAPAPAAAPAAPAAAGGGYLLQVGAFPSAAAADSLKAKLAMLGFVANVRQDTIGGSTVNRVRLGPYRSASELEAAKQRLSSNGIPAIALKENR